MSNIMNSSLTMIVLAFLIGTGSPAVAQQAKKTDIQRREVSKEKDKVPSTRTEVEQEEEMEETGADETEIPENEKSNKGNAYGKNKGDLEGREFGQARAADARMNREKKAEELEGSIGKNEEKAAAAREKIKAAKEKLEKDKEDKKVSEEEYKARKEKIEHAEKAVKGLEEKIERGKAVKDANP